MPKSFIAAIALLAATCFPVQPAHARAPEVVIYGPVECRTVSKCDDHACYTWTVCRRKICDANGCHVEERWL